MYKCEATNKCKELGSGCSTDGRAVASGARDTQFEATLMRHFWTFYLILLRLKTWINKTRLKLPDLKKYYFTSCWKFVGAVPNKILWKGKKWGGASWRNWQCHWKNTDWRSGQLNSNCQTFLVVRCGCWLRGRLWLAISHILNRVQCWKTHVLSLKLWRKIHRNERLHQQYKEHPYGILIESGIEYDKFLRENGGFLARTALGSMNFLTGFFLFILVEVGDDKV